MAIRKVNVQPTVDKNGVELPPSYISQLRDNLGSPSDYVSQGTPEERVVEMEVKKGDEIVPYVHKFTREDH